MRLKSRSEPVDVTVHVDLPIYVCGVRMDTCILGVTPRLTCYMGNCQRTGMVVVGAQPPIPGSR